MQKSGQDEDECDEEERERGRRQPPVLGDLDEHPDQDGHHDQRVHHAEKKQPLVCLVLLRKSSIL